ncbi:WecB/TagA/CpsF family glycosyltransferase [Ramlibacter algicola]|uniref:WecB/TagA/CpsF family glycosyltransferase n=1 Tax=Ramlibacter algicola TaxID=2795217 RepID=A0A934PZJ5_9BURK|nr:WecB/TagA/CpsF family glycosyltransferase [Ramlibacter algicola]MBK0391983.1 WecB/TagA/CpsF family glycosyltransferase [Ramlibacter algicola]
MLANSARVAVLDTPIAVGSFDAALEQISAWAEGRESRSVFFCNVHVVTTARMEPEFATCLRKADLCLPDGSPVARLVRQAGYPNQTRVSGPDVMESYLRLANGRRESVFLYGSTPETLDKLTAKLKAEHPDLTVHTYSPPFRELTAEEDAGIVDMINKSGAGTVWVALGCPKQERFIIEHQGRIKAVMLGVGAAFAFHAGVISRAPEWMQRSGLEWLHRLVTDPKRLWKRYLVTNTAFLYYVAMGKLTGSRKSTAVDIEQEQRAN